MVEDARYKESAGGTISLLDNVSSFAFVVGSTIAREIIDSTSGLCEKLQGSHILHYSVLWFCILVTLNLLNDEVFPNILKFFLF